ncbi:MAG: iron-sulfur cluster assembly accessory protein [Actinomycetota bacterium]
MLKLTDMASAKVRELLAEEQRDDLALRVALQSGGCSGFRYELFLDDRAVEGDESVDFNGVKVVVDPISAPFLDGAEIDFVESEEGAGFKIDNPNPLPSCHCGDGGSCQ